MGRVPRRNVLGYEGRYEGHAEALEQEAGVVRLPSAQYLDRGTHATI